MRELVKSVSIANIVNQRKAFFEEAQRLIASIERMDGIAKSFSNGKSKSMFMECTHERWMYRDGNKNGSKILVTQYKDEDPVEQIRLNVDRHIWSFLMDESGMRSFMDDAARKEWDEQLWHGKEIPCVTEDNVQATFEELYAGRRDLFERGVINVFKSLSWDYKTNSPCCFGKRIIMDRVIDTWMTPIIHWVRPNQRSVNELQDLERCLTMLDGKPEPDHRDSPIMEWAGLCQNRTVEENEWECDLFHFRWFKKGTLHVTFKRRDLVDEMNGIIAKHYPGALPARL